MTARPHSAAGSSSGRSDPSRTWLERLRAGDPAAATALQQAYRPALLRFCHGYLGCADAAEDAVQEVLAKALAAREVPQNVRTWLYAVARNHCLNVVRGQRRRRDGAALPPSSHLAAPATGFLSKLVRAEAHDRLAQAFAALPAAEQEALRLRYAEQLAREEIAAITGVPASTVKSRLFEGLQKLRAQLG